MRFANIFFLGCLRPVDKVHKKYSETEAAEVEAKNNLKAKLKTLWAKGFGNEKQTKSTKAGEVTAPKARLKPDPQIIAHCAYA